jgi:hypothetical protein
MALLKLFSKELQKLLSSVQRRQVATQALLALRQLARMLDTLASRVAANSQKLNRWSPYYKAFQVTLFSKVNTCAYQYTRCTDSQRTSSKSHTYGMSKLKRNKLSNKHVGGCAMFCVVYHSMGSKHSSSTSIRHYTGGVSR